MSHTLLCDMGRKSLNIFLARIEQQPDFSADQMRELLESCTVPVFILERTWQMTQALLDRGTEARQLMTRLMECIDLVDEGVKAFVAARERVSTADLSEKECSDGMAMLEKAAARAATIRCDLSALITRLQRRPACDPATLPGQRDNQQASEYIGLDELTRRLLSPKDS